MPNAVARNGTDKPDERVGPAEPVDGLEVDDDDRLGGHEQRGDEQKEQQPLARELAGWRTRTRPAPR